MHIALIVVHVLACFAIMGIVLLQAGKGADIGSAFGGAGTQAVFGSMGTPTVLGKITTVIAIVFTLTTGFVVDHFHSYAPILIVAGLLPLIGTIVLFAVGGRIDRLQLAEGRS